MKFLVALYQEKNQIDHYLNAIGIKHADIIEVGPFPSKVQAMQWADYLDKRSDFGRMERFNFGYFKEDPWYGAILAWRES